MSFIETASLLFLGANVKLFLYYYQFSLARKEVKKTTLDTP